MKKSQQPAAGGYPDYVRTKEQKRAYRDYLGDGVVASYRRLRAEILGRNPAPLQNWTDVSRNK